MPKWHNVDHMKKGKYSIIIPDTDFFSNDPVEDKKKAWSHDSERNIVGPWSLM